jgi:hypothetical protein
MLRKLAFAALCVAIGCKNGVPQPPAPLPGTCALDSECPADFRCDHEMRRCVCTGDAACPGKFCNAFTGQCTAAVEGCSTVADAGTVACGSGQYCNTALRSCRPITPFCGACKSDAECGEGSFCSSHPQFPNAGTFCIAKCGASDACANGLTCAKSTSGASGCFPAGACGNTNACVPDSLKPCSGDAACGDPAQTCDLSLAACIAKNRTCPPGDSCDPQARLCKQQCFSDDDCLKVVEHAPGYQCRANACFLLTLCSADSDCTNGQICDPNPDGSKSCRAGCASNGDCPLGESCNNDPAHPRCRPGCSVDTDCALNTICSAGACVSTTAACSTQTCQDTQVCPVGGNCINRCCVEANLATLCPPGGVCGACNASGCANNCNSNCFFMDLGPCSTTSQCAAFSGAVCNTSVGQCQVLAHLSGCTSDADCPQKGFKCLARSLVGCGDSGNVCYPSEQAAQIACALGHP